MLLFTLLTTLFLGSPAAPPKDTAQPVSYKPSVGLLFTTAPRAYQIHNNLGLVLRYPFGRRANYEAQFAIGGNLYYIENGLRAIYDSNSSTPIVGVPITYTLTYSLFSSISLNRRWCLSSKTSIITGIELGISKINQSEIYKTSPVTRQRSGWVNDSTPTTDYEYVKRFMNTNTYWVAVSLGVRQRLTRDWSIDISGKIGPRIQVEKLYGTGERFVTVKPYTGYVNGNRDPYNPVWDFKPGQIQSPMKPNKPLINSFDTWGFASVSLTVFYTFS